MKNCEKVVCQISEYSLSCQLTTHNTRDTAQQDCICFDYQLTCDRCHSYMADIEFKIKDKRRKLKKLNKISSSIPNSKVSSQVPLERSNSLI